MPRREMTGGGKFFLGLLIVLGVVNGIDYLFYGRELHDLVGTVGLGLMAYGVYKNSNRNKPEFDGDPSFDKRAHSLGGLGVVVVLGALAYQYLL